MLGLKETADTAQRVVAWRSLPINGTDYCALSRAAEGWLLKGTAIGVVQDARPMLANYEVYCDDGWRTHRVEVERIIGKDTKTLSLTVESRGPWRSSGLELPEFAGCVDVDLAVTPATNTLPIRRLKLEIGKSQPVTAAWIKFPELTIEPLSQRYTRIAQDRFRYESATGFSAEITVDDLGLVTVYPGGWERIASL
jgi:hypothetical protein